MVQLAADLKSETFMNKSAKAIPSSKKLEMQTSDQRMENNLDSMGITSRYFNYNSSVSLTKKLVRCRSSCLTFNSIIYQSCVCVFISGHRMSGVPFAVSLYLSLLQGGRIDIILALFRHFRKPHSDEQSADDGPFAAG